MRELMDFTPYRRTIIHACSLIRPEYEHILEFGVAEGFSLKLIAERIPDYMQIYGFDSFEGLPADWVSKDGKVFEKKGKFSTNGKVPDMVERAQYFKGLFKDTIPEYLLIAKPIALLNIDCDLYDSTNDVLYNLDDLIVSGTIIVFDEWLYFSDSHNEQRAFYEWVGARKRSFELVEYADGTNGQQIIRML